MPASASAWSISAPRLPTRRCMRNSGSPPGMWRLRPDLAWPGWARPARPTTWVRAGRLTWAIRAANEREEQAVMSSGTDGVLTRLTDAGVAVWLDDISRDRLSSGNLAALARDLNVRGVTSNPTIFAHALSTGTTYDGQVADLAVRGVSVDEAARAITTYDIRWACDVLRPVF